MFYVGLFSYYLPMLFILFLINTFSLHNGRIIRCIIFIITSHYFYIFPLTCFIKHLYYIKCIAFIYIRFYINIFILINIYNEFE
jgi:hypothetical protein